MSGEAINREQTHLSFEQLGEALATYEAADDVYHAACFRNKIHDEEGFATISGKDLEDWKSEHPRIDDGELGRLEGATRSAEAQLVETLGLESAEILPGLCETYHHEETRQMSVENESPDKESPWRYGIPIESGYYNTQDIIAGTIAMAKLTDKTYVMHGGPQYGMTYYYIYVNVGPDQELDSVITEFAERGVALTSSLALQT